MRVRKFLWSAHEGFFFCFFSLFSFFQIERRKRFTKMHDRRDGQGVYTPVAPAGVAGTGGTANYPASQKDGYGYDATKGANTMPTKAGYGGYTNYDNNNVNKNNNNYVHPHPQQQNQKGDYVATPMSYGGDGVPITVDRKRHRMRNAVLGALAVCCCCVAL